MKIIKIILLVITFTIVLETSEAISKTNDDFFRFRPRHRVVVVYPRHYHRRHVVYVARPRWHRRHGIRVRLY
jgi:hypothetical protein